MKIKLLSSVIMLSTTAAFLGSCSASCPTEQTEQKQGSLIISAPTEYPIGVNSMPVYVMNNSDESIKGVSYTTTNNAVTVNAGNCVNIPAKTGCYVYASVARDSHPGAFNINAVYGEQAKTNNSKDLSSDKDVKNKVEYISAGSSGLTELADNNATGADGIVLIYPEQVIDNPNGMTSVVITAIIASPNAGDFNTITLVDTNGKPLQNVQEISDNSGNGFTNLHQGAIVTLQVPFEETSNNQTFFVQTQKDGVVVNTSKNVNNIEVISSAKKTGIIELKPSYTRLNEAYPSQIYTVVNSGNGPLSNIMHDVVGDGLSISNSTCGNTLESGLSCTYTVNFDTTKSVANSGATKVNATVNAEGFNSSVTKSLFFTGKDVLAGLAITSADSNWDFVSTEAIPSDYKIVTIENPGVKSETIQSINPPALFSLDNSGLENACPIDAPFELVAKGSCEYKLVYTNSTVTPDSEALYSINYTYLDNANNLITDKSSVYLNYETLTSNANLSINKQSLSFPAIIGNGAVISGVESILIENQGEAIARNLTIATVGNGYSQTNNCGGSLNPGQSCIVNVQFGPLVSSETKDVSGNLSINYTVNNAGNVDNFDIPLSGDVLKPNSAHLEVDPKSVNISGFTAGDGSITNPYVLEKGKTSPTISAIMTNNSNESAQSLYIDSTNLSPGWSISPQNTCGTSQNKVDLAPGATCNIVLTLDTTIQGNYPLDYSSIGISWVDEANPNGSLINPFTGKVYTEVFQSTIRITPDMTYASKLINTDSSFVQSKFTVSLYGNSPFDQTVTLSSDDPSIKVVNSTCKLTKVANSCDFLVDTRGTNLGTYKLSISNSGDAQLIVNYVSVTILPFQTDLTSVVRMYNDDNGYIIVGANGTVVSTNDGGANWVEHKTGFGGKLWGATLSSNGTYYAVGDDGTILSSNDLNTWTTRSTGRAGYRYNVIAQNSLGNFFSVGYYGYNATSTNGIAWTTVNTSPSNAFNGHTVYGLTTDANGNFYACAANNHLFKSTDNGTTWTMNRVGSDNEYYWKGNAFNTSANVLVAAGYYGQYGDNGIITYSTDFGVTWHNPVINVPEALYGVAVNSNGVFVAVGEIGAIYKSTDNGVTWNKVTSGTTNSLTSVVANTNNTFMAVGSGGAMLVSTVDGSSWTRIN